MNHWELNATKKKKKKKILPERIQENPEKFWFIDSVTYFLKYYV